MNYVNNLSIFGFMNRNCEIRSNPLEYWKTKSHSHIVRCILPFDEIPTGIKKLSYMYLDDNPEMKGVYHMEQITSLIDSSFRLSEINRHNHKELYETYRKYMTRIEVIENTEMIKKRYDEILYMIELWRYSDYGGMKYGWQERAGVDKAFFERYINDKNLQEQISIYLFTHKELKDRIVGYSVMPNICAINEMGIPEVSYMLRKCMLKSDAVNLRNITEYIDWWTFNATMRKMGIRELAVNWGCSSGGVKWYKEHKWPLLYKENKWFLNLKITK